MLNLELLLSVLSLQIGLENLELNQKQIDSLDDHLKSQDNILRKEQNEEIINCLKKGDRKMHKMSIKKLIQDSKIDSLGNLLSELIDKVKYVDHDLYEEYDLKVYKCAYGEHISDMLLDKIYSDKISRHWTKEQTTAVGRNIAVDFTKFTECDFNYAMNYLYHTLYNSINSTDANSWGKMAKNWLTYNNPLKHFYYIKTL